MSILIGMKGPEFVGLMVCLGTIGIVFATAIARGFRRRKKREGHSAALLAHRQKMAERARHKSDGGQ